MTIPAAKEGFEAGETVRASLMVPRRQAGEAVLITGSHDPCLDRLADLVRPGGVEIHSTHTGSMGGLLTLKKRQCHAAPMHLLAPDGEYNIPFLQKYMPGEDLALICVAEREQGLISREGAALDDLPALRYANRQKGSGTRMLLDHLLKQKEIDPTLIRGYDREFTTHLVVGSADAVIAIGGKFGTLSEIALALKMKKPVFGVGTWKIEGVFPCAGPEEAVLMAVRASRLSR